MDNRSTTDCNDSRCEANAEENGSEGAVGGKPDYSTLFKVFKNIFFSQFMINAAG